MINKEISKSVINDTLDDRGKRRRRGNIAKVITRYVLGDLWGPNIVIIGRFSRSDEYIFAINGVSTIVTSPWEHFNRGFQSSKFVYIIIFRTILNQVIGI